MIRIINEFAVYYKYKIEIIKASISLLLKHLNKLQNTVKHSLISDIALVYKTFFSQEKFGDDIDITEGKKKIGTKNMDDYGSDANTDDMANDSDLDVSTCRLLLMKFVIKIQ